MCQRCQLQPLNRRQRPTDNAAEVTVEACRIGHGTFQLLLTSGPDSEHRALFCVQFFTQCYKRFDNSFNAMTKLRPGEITVEHFHLALSAVLRLPSVCHLK